MATGVSKDKTYIYLLAQFRDNGELNFNWSFKIGKANNLKNRFNQEYKNNTGYIHPKYIRVLEINTDYSVPDKKLHGFLDIICNSEHTKIERQSINRELYQFKDQTSIDWFDKMCELTGNKYYKKESEIDELLNKDTIEDICGITINNIITQVIIENSETESLTDNDNDNDNLNHNVSLEYMEIHNLINLAISKNPPRSSDNSKKYLGPANIKRIIKYIKNFEELRYLLYGEDHFKTKKYFEDLHKKLSICKKNGDFTSEFPETTVRCIIKMYS